MTTKRDAIALPQQLAAELAALDLPTFEQRRDAVNGASGIKGIRARYMSMLTTLCHTHKHSDLFCSRVGTDINRRCDTYILDVLPPVESGRYLGIPRST